MAILKSFISNIWFIHICGENAYPYKGNAHACRENCPRMSGQLSAHVRTNVRACRDICPQSPDSWGLPLYYIIRYSFAHALIPFLELLNKYVL